MRNLNFKCHDGRNLISKDEQRHVILHQRKCRDIKRNIPTSVLVVQSLLVFPLTILQGGSYRSILGQTFTKHVSVCVYNVYVCVRGVPLFPSAPFSAARKNEQLWRVLGQTFVKILSSLRVYNVSYLRFYLKANCGCKDPLLSL